MKKIIACLVSACILNQCALADSPVNVSFVQSADVSKLTAINTKTGTYKLSLKNINPHVTYFSDRPNRVIGQFTMAQYLAKWKQGKDSFNVDAPNAVLNAAFHTANDEDQFVNVFVELSNPVYSIRERKFSYDVKLLNNNRQPLNGVELHHAVLFIDEACLSCVG